MTDDVLSVPTTFSDVATLAQGYMNRADGERLLLPFAVPIEEGQGVRFVVMLGDGTPAFAGAGRAAQVSDQGDGVPPEARYETLLDGLQFDERSQPVYDYIVAVRTAAYAAPAEGEAAEAEAGGEAMPVDDAEIADDSGFDDEPTAYVGAPQSEPAEAYAGEGEVYEPADEAVAYAEPAEGEAYAGEGEVYEPAGEAYAAEGEAHEPAEGEAYAGEGEVYEPAAEAVAYAEPAAAEAYAVEGVEAVHQSIPAEAIPTGMLTRPALGVHWAPAVPRRPTPRPASGLFQYNGSGLPVPAGPPRPQLDPAYWVAPAPRPGDQAAEAAASEAPASGAAEAEAYAEPVAEEPTYAQEALDDGSGEPEYAEEAVGEVEVAESFEVEADVATDYAEAEPGAEALEAGSDGDYAAEGEAEEAGALEEPSDDGAGAAGEDPEALAAASEGWGDDEVDLDEPGDDAEVEVDAGDGAEGDVEIGEAAEDDEEELA